MIEDNRRKNHDKKKEVPNIKRKYVEASITIMLHKLGGSETLTLEQLENFPESDAAKIYWDAKKKAFTIAMPHIDVKKIFKPRLMLPN